MKLNENQPKEVYTLVHCKESRKEERVYSYYVSSLDRYICNGCEDCSGSTSCRKCMEMVEDELNSGIMR